MPSICCVSRKIWLRDVGISSASHAVTGPSHDFLDALLPLRLCAGRSSSKRCPEGNSPQQRLDKYLSPLPLCPLASSPQICVARPCSHVLFLSVHTLAYDSRHNPW